MSMATTPTEQQWLEQVRGCVLRGDHATAESLLSNALTDYPRSVELRRAQAGVCQQTQRNAQAESILRELLTDNPGDAAAAFLLARMLKVQGRMGGAATVIRGCFEHARHDAELAIQAIELLDDCDRKRDAFAIAEAAIDLHPDDPRLHAYAGMLALQLGDFERARRHDLFALEHSQQACEWHVPLGLSAAQRYADAAHPDFVRFNDCLRRADLGPKARSSLLFALGKAHDDIGDYARAAGYFREANALAHALTKWSRKHWRRAVEALLAARPIGHRLDPPIDFVPIFIVGVPRSGTTLVAERLSRHRQVCNRGESPWLALLASQTELTGDPDRNALQRAAATYIAQVRQDDAANARWFIDKQPLNLRYLDLALALFPNAKIIHCRRNPRDTALSLWSQSFTEEVQGYAYDLADIALVMNDCDRLMARWSEMHAGSIRDLRYEQLVADPAAIIGELTAWLGLPALDALDTVERTSTSITTASLWQARQPVYTRSVGRWKSYMSYVPELLKFPAE